MADKQAVSDNEAVRDMIEAWAAAVRRIDVTAETDVAFAVTTMGCARPNSEGKPEPLDFRMTMCLKKSTGDG